MLLGCFFGHVNGVLRKYSRAQSTREQICSSSEGSAFLCNQCANLLPDVFWSHERKFLSNGLILKDIAFFFFFSFFSIKIKQNNENNF